MDNTDVTEVTGMGFYEVIVGREVAENLNWAQKCVICILSE